MSVTCAVRRPARAWPSPGAGARAASPRATPRSAADAPPFGPRAVARPSPAAVVSASFPLSAYHARSASTFAATSASARSALEGLDEELGPRDGRERDAVVIRHAEAAQGDDGRVHRRELFALLHRELVPERQRHRLLRLVEEDGVAALDLGVVGFAPHRAQLADARDDRDDIHGRAAADLERELVDLDEVVRAPSCARARRPRPRRARSRSGHRGSSRNRCSRRSTSCSRGGGCPCRRSTPCPPP